MSRDLQALEEWAGALLAKLDAGERRKLMGNVARDLRRSQQKRIATQRSPDGTPFAPRKLKVLREKQGRIKAQMFTKLRTARYMRVQSTNAGAAVEFIGRVSRIARVHHYGMKDRPARGQPDVRYAPRELLGFALQDAKNVSDLLMQHLKS
ncbi:phage virion morphogenesis protein [Pseudomonas sp. UBA4194]|uniref:phage virion morphogenesis protein n=1 Tax=Pseudomonas sp. UBA4194 TaxID=1947317 RepID=UPI0025FDA6C6|nr:phage virion morphogenesis protein [Pseudomonas sp. UBA4194]